MKSPRTSRCAPKCARGAGPGLRRLGQGAAFGRSAPGRRRAADAIGAGAAQRPWTGSRWPATTAACWSGRSEVTEFRRPGESELAGPAGDRDGRRGPRLAVQGRMLRRRPVAVADGRGGQAHRLDPRHGQAGRAPTASRSVARCARSISICGSRTSTRATGKRYDMPVLYITQLLGLVPGHRAREARFEQADGLAGQGGASSSATRKVLMSENGQKKDRRGARAGRRHRRRAGVARSGQLRASRSISSSATPPSAA